MLINYNFYKVVKHLEPSYNRNLIIHFATRDKNTLKEIIALSEPIDEATCYNQPDFKITRLIFIKEFFFNRFGRNNFGKSNELFDNVEHSLGIKLNRKKITQQIKNYYRKLTWLRFCTDYYWFPDAAKKILNKKGET